VNYDERYSYNLRTANQLIEDNNAYESYYSICLKYEFLPLSKEDFIRVIARIITIRASLKEKAEMVFELLSNFKNLPKDRPLLNIKHPTTPHLLHENSEHALLLLIEFKPHTTTISCIVGTKK